MEKIALFQAKRIALKGGMDIDRGRTLWPQQHGSVLDATAVTRKIVTVRTMADDHFSQQESEG